MTQIIPKQGSANAIELEDFVTHVDKHLDVRDEESVIALAPQLAALSANKQFFSRFLAESLAQGYDFQKDNHYVGPAFVLAQKDDYIIRLACWSPDERDGMTPDGKRTNVYTDDIGMAHNHTFALLTAGYWGPGYETDLFECDPNDLPENAGEAYSLVPRGREQLSEGKIMFYRAFSDVHIQHPPSEFSISLNLIALKTHLPVCQHHFFDVRQGKIMAVATRPRDQASLELLKFASMIRDPSFLPHLEELARIHPDRLVRTMASFDPASISVSFFECLYLGLVQIFTYNWKK